MDLEVDPHAATRFTPSGARSAGRCSAQRTPVKPGPTSAPASVCPTFRPGSWSSIQRNGSSLYVGTDEGVYELASGTSTWLRFGAGMPNVQVRDLELNQTTNTLLAGTYGRGVYQLSLDDGAANAGASSASRDRCGCLDRAGLPGRQHHQCANGTAAQVGGLSTSSLTIVGSVSDLTPGSLTLPSPRLVVGAMSRLAGVNTYGGTTLVQQGNLIVEEPAGPG